MAVTAQPFPNQQNCLCEGRSTKPSYMKAVLRNLHILPRQQSSLGPSQLPSCWRGSPRSEGAIYSASCGGRLRIFDIYPHSTDRSDTAHSVSLRQFLQAQAHKSLETFFCRRLRCARHIESRAVCAELFTTSLRKRPPAGGRPQSAQSPLKYGDEV
jgi:hypothetical protein